MTKPTRPPSFLTETLHRIGCLVMVLGGASTLCGIIYLLHLIF